MKNTRIAAWHSPFLSVVLAISSLLTVIEGINEAMGNEPIITVISAGECAQAEHPEINACMNRIDFSLQGAR